MRKLLVAAIIVVFVLESVSAQTSLGLKSGINLANLTGDIGDGFKSKIGFHAGAFIEFEISDVFSFQPELMFSMQGTKAKENNAKVNLNYLILPLIAKFYVVEGLSLEAGPQIGLLLSGKINGGGSDGLDLKEVTNNIDTGLTFGLGYKLDSGIFFSGRYNLGLSSVDDSNGEFWGNKTKNSVIQVSTGYRF